MEKLQKDLDRLWEWADENEIKINPSKCKAVLLTKASVKDSLNYKLRDQLIPEVSRGKSLGNILHSELSWTDLVNYTLKKSWKAIHFTMRILKNGNSCTKYLSYTTLVLHILEFGVPCWDP